jgi:hypothetical protein
MSQTGEWFALSGFIKGLQEAGELYARFMGYQKEDNYGAGQYLRAQCGIAVRALEQFRTDFAKSLPSNAADCNQVSIGGQLDARERSLLIEIGLLLCLLEPSGRALVVCDFPFCQHQTFHATEQQGLVRWL